MHIHYQKYNWENIFLSKKSLSNTMDMQILIICYIRFLICEKSLLIWELVIKYDKNINKSRSLVNSKGMSIVKHPFLK